MKKAKRFISAIAILGLPLAASAADHCSAADVKQIALDVNTNAITRAAAPKELFGFNVPWLDFQLGYVRNGVVRPDLFPYMAPFKGAVYRYPGGSPSNNFEWKKTVGAVSARSAIIADFDNSSVAKFGLDEFASFVNQSGGRAILTLNISGRLATPITATAASSDAVAMLSYLRTTSPFKCVAGPTCGVMGVELGNELDFSPYNWTATAFVARANAVIGAVNATPGLAGIQWIAPGRTSPWSATNYAVYNATLAAGLASRVQGVAIHPYYDGIDVPYAMNFVKNFGKAWTDKRPDAKIFVTEHARWPTVPKTGSWGDNWYQATGIGGAISAADFLLALINNSQVAAGNWHALGLSGPWQLIRVSKLDDSLYPSPVYWGLRTAREAYLDNVVQTRYTTPNVTAATYSGGYDVKMVGMSAANGSAASVIGVNRNSVPYKINITWSAGSRKAGTGTLRSITSASLTTDNTDTAKTAVTMLSSTKALGARNSSSWCVPPQSVFSIVEP